MTKSNQRKQSLFKHTSDINDREDRKEQRIAREFEKACKKKLNLEKNKHEKNSTNDSDG